MFIRLPLVVPSSGSLSWHSRRCRQSFLKECLGDSVPLGHIPLGQTSRESAQNRSKTLRSPSRPRTNCSSRCLACLFHKRFVLIQGSLNFFPASEWGLHLSFLRLPCLWKSTLPSSPCGQAVNVYSPGLSRQKKGARDWSF